MSDYIFMACYYTAMMLLHSKNIYAYTLVHVEAQIWPHDCLHGAALLLSSVQWS